MIAERRQPSLAGMASIAMGGMGLLFAGKKREWLYRRFVTERLRQFHFQAFALLLPEIISSQQTAEDKANSCRCGTPRSTS